MISHQILPYQSLTSRDQVVFDLDQLPPHLIDHILDNGDLTHPILPDNGTSLARPSKAS